MLLLLLEKLLTPRPSVLVLHGTHADAGEAATCLI